MIRPGIESEPLANTLTIMPMAQNSSGTILPINGRARGQYELYTFP